MFSISNNSPAIPRGPLWDTPAGNHVFIIKIKYETENNMNKAVFFENKVLLVM